MGLSGMVFLTKTGEPVNLQEAVSNKNWKVAMDKEFTALMYNKTWHLVSPVQQYKEKM